MRGLIPIFDLGAIRVAREPDERAFGANRPVGYDARKADRPVEPVPVVAGGAAEKVE